MCQKERYCPSKSKKYNPILYHLQETNTKYKGHSRKTLRNIPRNDFWVIILTTQQILTGIRNESNHLSKANEQGNKKSYIL